MWRTLTSINYSSDKRLRRNTKWDITLKDHLPLTNNCYNKPHTLGYIYLRAVIWKKIWFPVWNCTASFSITKIKAYFLKRWRSSAPSEVVLKVTFSISIHSLSRGSPVRSPVALRAWRERRRATLWSSQSDNKSIQLRAVNVGCEGPNKRHYPAHNSTRERLRCLNDHIICLRAINPTVRSHFVLYLECFLLWRTHCGEFVCRDFLLALCDGVEEQILQAGQDACFPSPAGKQMETDSKVRKRSSQWGPMWWKHGGENCRTGRSCE